VRRQLVALALVAALAATGCSVIGGGGDSYTVTAFFPRAVALYASSDVRVLGLKSGSIKKVQVEGSTVRVVLSIDENVPLPRDVQAQIVPQSLIGERYVQLFPAWTEGDAKLADGATIPLTRTAVPVEPDEALAALKEFLDSLDPKATGRLVKNLADDLRGGGGTLNDALKNLAGLTTTLAEKSDTIGRIIDQFDDFTATIATRERVLARVLDDFAELTGALADERRAVENVVRGLGQVASDGVDLVSEHGAALDRDLTVVTRVLQSAVANLDSVRQLLDSGPLLVRGLHDAYNPEFRRVELRQSTSPTVAQAFTKILGPLGIALPGNIICLPIDVQCVPSGQAAGAARSGSATVKGTAAAGATATARTPVDHLLDLLGSPGRARVAAVAPSRSVAERVARSIGGFGGFLRGAARELVGGKS
jgi:phospholipid/cholesterol/gamma-HCH transport system substrate-binding protein